MYLAHQAQVAASGVDIGIDPGVALTVLDQALNLQVTYGAVMLSFLGLSDHDEGYFNRINLTEPSIGALHWGMEIASYGGQKGYARLALGAAPMLVAWPTLGMQPMMALLLQWVGFTGLWLADSKATTAGWSTSLLSNPCKLFNSCHLFPFSPEMVLSVQVLFVYSCWFLVGVFLDLYCIDCRSHVFIMFSILGSVAGTSYWGPVAGHGFLSHDLDLIREERKNMPVAHGIIQGPIEAVPAGMDADHYTKIHNKDTEKN